MMGFAYDFSADFLTLDNLVPLTLRIAGQADQAIPSARTIAENQRPRPSRRPSPAGRSLLGLAYRRHPNRTATGLPPDRLLRAILDHPRHHRKQTPWGVWTAHCRNLAVANGLNNVAQVWKATYTKSPAGEALATYSLLLSGIPARFQPLDTTEQILEDAEWPKTTYHVILATDIFAPEIPVEPASADYRLVDSAGRHYRIMKYTRAQRIDALPIAECVLIIEGSEGNAIDRLSSSGA